MTGLYLTHGEWVAGAAFLFCCTLLAAKRAVFRVIDHHRNESEA
jgi:hypothetical protein